MWSHYADALRSACFHFIMKIDYEEILKDSVEVKAWSDKYLAKCTTLVRGDDTYF